MWSYVVALVAQVVTGLVVSTPLPLTVEDLPSGPPPRVAIDGSVPYDRGRLMPDGRFFEGTRGLSIVRDGRVVDSWCSSGEPVRRGGWVAWTELICPESGEVGESTLVRARADGTGLVRIPVTGLTRVVGLDRGTILYDGLNGGTWLTDGTGPPRRIRGSRQVVDVDERHDRVASHRRVLSYDGTVRWRSQHGWLGRFSPDGTRVLAVQRHDLRVLDAGTGALVATLALPAGASSWDQWWEGDQHVLAQAELRGRTVVLRLGLDGSVERS